MFRSRDELGLGVGVLSRSWLVRAVTVLVVGVAWAGIGFAWDRTLEALILGFVVGIVFGVGCAVMGESSMETGAYRYPEKHL